MLTVRSYRPADRAAVRRICADTAAWGRPFEELFPDRELAADAFVSGFTDFEPESCFVAEESGGVVGYAAGALDARRERRVFLRRVLPKLVLRGLARCHWLRPRAWRLALAGLRMAPARRRALAAVTADYPATCHLNLDARFRGKGTGSALLAAFLDYARAHGVRGVHVSAASEDGKRFFARHGFAVIARHPLPELPGAESRPAEVWLMGRAL